MSMQRSSLDLKNFIPLWEHEFIDLVHETEFDRLLGSDVNLLKDRIAARTCRQRTEVFPVWREYLRARARCF